MSEQDRDNSMVSVSDSDRDAASLSDLELGLAPDAEALVPEEVAARKISSQLFGERFPLAEQYVALLRSEGVVRGLIGPRELDRIWSRHILNSVAGYRLFPEQARVADVGSGAGLPGIPLVIIRPDLSMTLIESMLRRTTFLTEVVTALGLESQVTVQRGRAEEITKHFDVVTARAVAPLEKLIGWTLPLFAPHGELLALKGETAADEVKSAAKYLKAKRLTAEVLNVRAHTDVDSTYIVRVHAL